MKVIDAEQLKMLNAQAVLNVASAAKVTRLMFAARTPMSRGSGSLTFACRRIDWQVLCKESGQIVISSSPVIVG
jgi:hypothetical protein